MSEEQAEYVTEEQPETPNEEVEQLETEEPEPEPEKEPWFKRRIDELTRDKHEARRQSERLEKLLEQQEATLKSLQPKPEPIGIQPPNPEDFTGGTYDPRYMQAMLQYTKESAVAEARQAIQAEYEQRGKLQAESEKQSRLMTAESAARAKYQDYDAVIEPITSDPQLAGNPTIRAALLEMDNGPEIAYLLGHNLDLAYELSGMNQIQAGIKLASILNDKQPGRTAPKPINPIRGTGGSATTQKELGDMSTAEYIAFMNAKDREARAARFKR